MGRIYPIIALTLFFLFTKEVLPQSHLSNIRKKKVPVKIDSLTIDTVSIAPNSLSIFAQDYQIPESHYSFSPEKAQFHWTKKPKEFNADSFTFIYRVLPLTFKKTHRLKKPKVIDTSTISYRHKARPTKEKIRNQKNNQDFGQLKRNGSITRGVQFGNNQDITLNSNLDLQIAGNLTEDIDLQASITDQNLPIEPEGNTAQLQDFDKVKIDLTTKNEKLTLGDFQMNTYKKDYFMNYFKKTQGISLQRTWETGNKGKANAGVDFGFSRGKFARNAFNGNEGDQGPYQLKGNNGEIYIVIVAGTERVFLNGDQLKRGQQADYTIDYNSGEITFTQEHIISQNDRIVVEFQYAKRNYERSILHTYGKHETDKLALRANLFSEQDHKKNPLFQDLTDEDEALMSSIGDSTQNAIRPSFSQRAFSKDRILYNKIDTAGYKDVFVHATDEERKTYEVSFSNVGQGEGNYIKAASKANGQVYKWLKPKNGQPRGNYEPVKKLVTPKKQQMATIGADYQYAEKGTAGVELALSNKDVNTFSNREDGDDKDIASKAYIEKSFHLTDQEKPWQLNTKGSMEIKRKGFRPIERYRSVEFERQWNRQLVNPQTEVNKDELLGKIRFEFKKEDFLTANYQLSQFNKRNYFNGRLHKTGLELDLGKYDVVLKNDFTDINRASNSERFSNKDFLHQKAHVSRETGLFQTGLKYEREVNQHLHNNTSSLDSQSFRYEEWEAYAKSPDTSKEVYTLRFTQRWNYRPTNKNFTQATKSDVYSGKIKLHKDEKNDIDFSAKYRRFKVINDEIQDQEAKNSAVGNLEWDWEGFDDVLDKKTFYQISNGKEQKTEYQYVRARGEGRGNYVWEDYNNNGIQEIDEFQKANENNDFRANYIRVITPTNEFINTVSNEFRENLKIKPGNAIDEKDGIKKIISRLRNETSFSLQQKVFDRQQFKQYHPFNRSISDTNLVTTNSRIKNIFYFNKTHPTFGANFRYTKNEGKNLLRNGFTSRTTNEKALNLRWNISKTWSLHPTYLKGQENTQSELLTQQNYRIHFNEWKSEVNYRPTGKFQTSLTYSFESYENLLEGQNENSKHHQLQTKFRYNWIGKGSINASLAYTEINFSGNENSSAAYQILQGLNPGNNLTWRLILNYELGENLQLSVNYNGRDSENRNTIHQSNVNVRYLF